MARAGRVTRERPRSWRYGPCSVLVACARGRRNVRCPTSATHAARAASVEWSYYRNLVPFYPGAKQKKGRAVVTCNGQHASYSRPRSRLQTRSVIYTLRPYGSQACSLCSHVARASRTRSAWRHASCQNSRYLHGQTRALPLSSTTCSARTSPSTILRHRPRVTRS